MYSATQFIYKKVLPYQLFLEYKRRFISFLCPPKIDVTLKIDVLCKQRFYNKKCHRFANSCTMLDKGDS
jgi:hypothetical protein